MVNELKVENLLGVREEDLRLALAQAGPHCKVSEFKVDDQEFLVVEPGTSLKVQRKCGYVKTVLPKMSYRVLF